MLNSPLGQGLLIQLKDLNFSLSHQPRAGQHCLSNGHVVREDEGPATLPDPCGPRGRGVEMAELAADGLHQAAGAGPACRARGLSKKTAERQPWRRQCGLVHSRYSLEETFEMSLTVGDSHGQDRRCPSLSLP